MTADFQSVSKKMSPLEARIFDRPVQLGPTAIGANHRPLAEAQAAYAIPLSE
jgi:hypothetical protein